MELPKISAEIRNRRVELGLSLEYVAKKLGVNRSTVLRWEQGKINGLNRSHIYLLSKILYIPIEVLFGLEGKEMENSEIVKARLDLIEQTNKIDNLEDLKKLERYIKFVVLGK